MRGEGIPLKPDKGSLGHFNPGAKNLLRLNKEASQKHFEGRGLRRGREETPSRSSSN